jgi:acyl-CoA dehydrogenase-like protein
MSAVKRSCVDVVLVLIARGQRELSSQFIAQPTEGNALLPKLAPQRSGVDVEKPGRDKVGGFAISRSKPIGGFQLVQDLLVRMLGNVTSTQAMMLRLAQLQDQGLMQDEHASLAKAFCTVKCRETVGYARELLGGNGILLENHIGRFVADAEAIYSYEGTREMNTLIVGKAITGLSAFV